MLDAFVMLKADSEPPHQPGGAGLFLTFTASPEHEAPATQSLICYRGEVITKLNESRAGLSLNANRRCN